MQKRRRRRRIGWSVVVLLLLVGGFYLANRRFQWIPLPGQVSPEITLGEGMPGAIDPATGLPFPATSPIQRANDFIPDLTVGGKLEFRTIYEIKAPFDETVESVQVENGTRVDAGTPLIALQTESLNNELSSAWLELTKARQALSDLVKQSSTTALMEANAELLAAQEDLRKLEEGPSQADIRAAQLSISDAQLAYEDLINRNDPNAK
ncbi:MAG: efflux RND transporter periplasmic adaptor subunit, partial [Caldilineaceae bacterium]|nr:efflux RND transporter periplasmic adaptor subunit [Caldilineaceae bacterium]